MSLITRCPACGTMFKVVADQLKVSRGWVRCGHCIEVFDASLHLQTATLEPLSTASFTSDSRSPDDSTQEAASCEAVKDKQQPAPTKKSLLAKASNSQTVSGMRDERQPNSVEVNKSTPEHEHYTTPFYTEDSVKPASSHTAPSTEVSFVRNAKRKAFWRKPIVSAVLIVCCLLLAFILVLQIVAQQHDQIAASQPALKPWLNKLCEQLHCDVEAVRRIETVMIDNSTFTKLDADSYRLSFSLRNIGATPVAMPFLEVTLTDMQNQAVVRRVLEPAQFGAPATLLAAGADFSGFIVMQVLTNTSTAASPDANTVNPYIAGYRMLAFYP